MSSKYAAWRGNKKFLLALLKGVDSLAQVNAATLSTLLPGNSPKVLYDRLRYLEHKGYIKKFGANYQITSIAQTLLTESAVWELTIPTPAKWDGKWRCVLFDIPKDKRKRRDAFRLRIKELGFVLYQNSVWIHPYPCEEVVTPISSFYHLTKYVSFVTADTISHERKLLTHFVLKK